MTRSGTGIPSSNYIKLTKQTIIKQTTIPYIVGALVICPLLSVVSSSCSDVEFVSGAGGTSPPVHFESREVDLFLAGVSSFLSVNVEERTLVQ